MNKEKLEIDTAYAASKAATEADKEPRVDPRLRPTARISIVAGMVVAATLTTMIDTGNVASALLLVNPEPMMPPSVTIAIAPVAEISWQMSRTDRLRTDMSGAFSHKLTRIIAAC